jgi:hypothetical protein
VGILKKYHFPAAFVWAGYHQTCSADLTFIKNKRILAAFRTWNHKLTATAGADPVALRYFSGAGGTQNREGIAAAAFRAKPGIRIDECITEKTGLFIRRHKFFSFP